ARPFRGASATHAFFQTRERALAQDGIFNAAHERTDKLSRMGKQVLSSIEERCRPFATHRINLSADVSRIARFNVGESV
ncbi:hypothetical protein, partial [Burkholderia cenocepacia]|uniref:hypothetical protein n=1 Tax=Burkholderia cenocepacia TaxID=95486 RepID=UPI001C4E1B2A